MEAGEAGISWTEPAPFPTRPTLFYARSSDGSVRSLGTLTKTNQGVERIAETDKRLYWAVPDPAANSQEPFQCVLMSANDDGTDIREVCAQRDKHPIESMALHAYRGSLYCCLTEVPTITKDGTLRQQYLCRLHPERSDPLETLYKLPGKPRIDQFDGGCLYFVWSETKRSVWAAMTNDNVGMDYTDSFCRISLDH